MADTTENNTNNTDNVFKLPNAKEIEALKKKYDADLHQVTVLGKDGAAHHAILRQPKLNDMQIAASSEAKKKFTFNQSIWANCKVVGDPAIEADDFLFMGALDQINELVRFAESSVKKL